MIFGAMIRAYFSDDTTGDDGELGLSDFLDKSLLSVLGFQHRVST